jgi:hypothetical protein
MVIRKILEFLMGSRESLSPEHPREPTSSEHPQEPVSFEQARAAFERAQVDYEIAERVLREIQRQDEAHSGITRRWMEAAQRVDAQRHRLRQAKTDFILAGGSPDTVELTELVTRKVKQWFPADEQAEAVRLLETECARNLPFCDAWDAKDLEGVRLAVVKLSGGRMAELRRQVEEAKLDWRDVLAYAQAPEAVKRGLFVAEEDAETREINARDRQQYEEWLRGDGPTAPPAA